MIQPRLLPPPPQTQAHHSSTFQPPPLDGTLNIPQMYDWHFQNTPVHRLFVYARADGSLRDIYWPEAVHAIYVGAKILRDRFNWTAGTSEMPIVAILASSDAIPYFTLFMSCLRANYVPFPISPRNSPSAIAHLLHKTGVRHLLIGPEPTMIQLATDALVILKEEYLPTVIPDVSYVPLFQDLFDQISDIDPTSLPFEYHGPDATAFMAHSSAGSTAFPKPIYWTHHRTIQGALIPWFGERDLTGQILSLHSMPMYHGMGLLQTFWSAACGSVLSAFEPASPPTMPSPENVLHGSKMTGTDIIFCVPSFTVEAWSRKPEYVQWLATRSGVLFGGGPLSKEVGDYMTSQGVSIFNLYGSGEGGIMSPILPAQAGFDWEYFRFPDLVTAEMIPHGDNTFELVMVSNEFCRPSVLNTRVAGIDAYATSDLMVPHPDKKGYWKIYGRADDQIMHSTGEKTNPGPLETMFNQDPHVLSSVMFGRGYFQAGVLVDPKPPFKFDPSDTIKLAEFRNMVWPTVMRMNEFAPQHSRLFKEMILVAKPQKPFTYTAKMTVRRQAVIANYEEEIIALYDTVDQTASLSIPALVQWDPDSIFDFVRDAVCNVMDAHLGDDEDIFQHGCDSLQATWIRNCLLRALREMAQLDTRQKTDNFVYEYPTISRLAQFIFGIASGKGDQDVSITSKSNVMLEMVAKYSQDFATHTGARQLPPSTEKVVIVTGTTGELGCYLLSVLLADDNVDRVYAINRSSPWEPALRDRQARGLLERGLDTSILDSPKLLLLAGDTARSGFDLPISLYQQGSHTTFMQECVTHIVHTAWPVDFNLALRSFDPNIKGLRELLDFSLGSPYAEPPTFLYASSIGLFQNVNETDSLRETTVGSEVAIGSGYSESKWVGEQILSTAAECTALKPVIIRIGQLSGGINGAWNTHEWLPTLVQSAKTVGCIPDDRRNVTWLPVQVAAAAIIDFLEIGPSTRIVHLVNPQPVPWSTLGKIIASELSVPLVPYAEWLSRVESASKTRKSSGPFRAPRLLEFFRSRNLSTGPERDAFGLPKLDMANALSASQGLQFPKCRLGENDVKLWMMYWRSVGLL
ncbi:hypothetical protein DFH07DRAFT_921322 [Mycena maculata]|uniref:Acetyl-CoA synthetase-like protein n=1 Tax=Mycena maculata TaxID=230809 RepID=A0AAD7J190_9AGAR|nr:hypothetical protein DFH07DRAFT_921322 [Mycena maculata]